MIEQVEQLKEMELRTLPGEIRLYLSLHLIQNMTIFDALKLAESLGFTPDIRYRTWNFNGRPEIGLYAVLHEEKRDFNSVLEPNYVTDEAFERLCSAILPDTAVHFGYCLKDGRLAA